MQDLTVLVLYQWREKNVLPNLISILAESQPYIQFLYDKPNSNIFMGYYYIVKYRIKVEQMQNVEYF